MPLIPPRSDDGAYGAGWPHRGHVIILPLCPPPPVIYIFLCLCDQPHGIFSCGRVMQESLDLK